MPLESPPTQSVRGLWSYALTAEPSLFTVLIFEQPRHQPTKVLAFAFIWSCTCVLDRSLEAFPGLYSADPQASSSTTAGTLPLQAHALVHTFIAYDFLSDLKMMLVCQDQRPGRWGPSHPPVAATPAKGFCRFASLTASPGFSPSHLTFGGCCVRRSVTHRTLAFFAARYATHGSSHGSELLMPESGSGTCLVFGWI